MFYTKLKAMPRLKKRNNYTLSTEAQQIIDFLPSYHKSKWVSDAIILKNKIDQADFDKVVTTIKAVEVIGIKDGKIDRQTFPGNNVECTPTNIELLFTAIEDGNFNIRLQKGDKIIRP